MFYISFLIYSSVGEHLNCSFIIILRFLVTSFRKFQKWFDPLNSPCMQFRQLLFSFESGSIFVPKLLESLRWPLSSSGSKSVIFKPPRLGHSIRTTCGVIRGVVWLGVVVVRWVVAVACRIVSWVVIGRRPSVAIV